MPTDYTPEGMGKALHDIKEAVEEISENTEEKESHMDNIAGLLALMQNNKNMDLPGLLALCRERGCDRSFSNNGEFMTIFLLLFLLGNGGWGGLNAANRAAFQECAGDQCQRIIGIHDRISAAQAASTQGFQSMQTWLCEAIANVTSAVRNQGDRAVDATRDVQTQMQNCCCNLERGLDSLNCKVDGVGAKVELSQERTMNAMQAMECRLGTIIKENRAAMELGFERQTNLINEKFAQQKMEQMEREIADLKAAKNSSDSNKELLATMQQFFLAHYTPNKTPSPTA